MGYVVFQTKGFFADKAHEFEALRMSGKMSDAVKLYQDVMNDHRELKNEDGFLPSINSTWWIFCASENIRQNHGIKQSELSENSNSWSSYRLTMELIRLATKKHGGEWSYFQEY